MSPETLKWIGQEIRHGQSQLTVEESWAQKQPASFARDEIFRRIILRRYFYRLEQAVVEDYLAACEEPPVKNQRERFWRTVQKLAEHQLAR